MECFRAITRTWFLHIESGELTMNHPSQPSPTKFGGITDVGMKRSSNQDNYLFADFDGDTLLCESSIPESASWFSAASRPQSGQLLIVADGMGGHTNGAHASRMAIEYNCRYLAELLKASTKPNVDDDDELREALAAGVVQTHQLLRREGKANPEIADMGTTLTMALICRPWLYVTHVGDSRCYVYRNGAATQLTADHTVAQMLRNLSEVPDDKTAYRSFEHVLWNSVSAGKEPPQPQVMRRRIYADDTILLCSDGLTNYLTASELSATLESNADITQVMRELVSTANERGGRDNITAVVARLGATAPKAAFECGLTLSDSLADTAIIMPS